MGAPSNFSGLQQSSLVNIDVPLLSMTVYNYNSVPKHLNVEEGLINSYNLNRQRSTFHSLWVTPNNNNAITLQPSCVIAYDHHISPHIRLAINLWAALQVLLKTCNMHNKQTKNGFASQWNIGFMLKFALPLTPNLKFALPPKPTPDASQWNIGGVGSQMQISCVGHLHFIFCV